VLDKLLADGTLLGYGLLIPIVHVTGAPTHTLWYWTNTMADIDKVQAALRGAREKRSKEQNTAFQARLAGIFEPNSHTDTLMEVMMSAVK
jgi:hypothetical protein